MYTFDDFTHFVRQIAPNHELDQSRFLCFDVFQVNAVLRDLGRSKLLKVARPPQPSSYTACPPSGQTLSVVMG